MQIFCNCNRTVDGQQRPLWPQIAHCAGLLVAYKAESQLYLHMWVGIQDIQCMCVWLCVCVSHCVFGVCLASLCLRVRLVVSPHWNLIQLWKGNFTHSIEYYDMAGGEGMMGRREEGQPRHDLNGTLGVQIGTMRPIWNWKRDTNTHVICCCLLLFLFPYIYLPLPSPFSGVFGNLWRAEP